jgi:hypothetical protein
MRRATGEVDKDTSFGGSSLHVAGLGQTHVLGKRESGAKRTDLEHVTPSHAITSLMYCHDLSSIASVYWFV